jgi:carbonic anhydrase
MKKISMLVLYAAVIASMAKITVAGKPGKSSELIVRDMGPYHCNDHKMVLSSEQSFQRMIGGYDQFRNKYVHRDAPIMQCLSHHGQKPHTMVIACCDSRVDPALLLQCDPGDLFVVRNVANIVAPAEHDVRHHSTAAALEFAVGTLKVQHLIILGHSQCGGVKAASQLKNKVLKPDDFINNWVSLIKMNNVGHISVDEYAKLALHISHQNCLTYPWIQEKLKQKKLKIHLWFFDIKTGQILTYCDADKKFNPLGTNKL